MHEECIKWNNIYNIMGIICYVNVLLLSLSEPTCVAIILFGFISW